MEPSKLVRCNAVMCSSLPTERKPSFRSPQPETLHRATDSGGVSLTPKQARFVEEYLLDLSATDAACRAGFEFATKPAGFYVYLLTDPRDGRVFYVGKGKGKRMLSHQRDARRLDSVNPRKTARILEILDAGLQVDARLFESGLDEAKALTLERTLIAAIGKQNLTNHASGIVTHEEQAKMLLSRVKPFEQWAVERNASEFERHLYDEVVQGLKRIATGKLRVAPGWVSCA